MAIRLRLQENRVRLKVGGDDSVRLKVGAEIIEILPDPYTGELVVTPKAHEQQTLECAHKTMPDNVVVLKVPYYETHNDSGLTAYIANEV